MKKIKRCYLYNSTIKEILEYADKNKLKWETPNRKENMPFYVEKYIKYLKSLVD